MTPQLSHSKGGSGGGQEFRPEESTWSSESSERHLVAETSSQLAVGAGAGAGGGMGRREGTILPAMGSSLVWDL